MSDQANRVKPSIPTTPRAWVTAVIEAHEIVEAVEKLTTQYQHGFTEDQLDRMQVAIRVAHEKRLHGR